MDNQFHTLAKSYIDNYVEYAKTNTPAYKTAYQSAEQGIQSILEQPIDDQKQTDELKAAELRQQTTTSFEPSNYTIQFVAIGLLSTAVIGAYILL